MPLISLTLRILTNLGRPTYFDLSVRCTTQPSYISSAASKAGVAAAAAAGEEAKDDHYLEMVNAWPWGGLFSVPWSASRLVFGLHLHYPPYLPLPIPLLQVALARKRLLQLLFGNAKMILRYYALYPEDGIDLLVAITFHFM